MRRDTQTWILANRLVERHGPDALSEARRAAETLWNDDDTEPGLSCREVVKAMDLLLSDEGFSAIH